jgi:hypothetical protein
MKLHKTWVILQELIHDMKCRPALTKDYRMHLKHCLYGEYLRKYREKCLWLDSVSCDVIDYETVDLYQKQVNIKASLLYKIVTNEFRIYMYSNLKYAFLFLLFLFSVFTYSVSNFPSLRRKTYRQDRNIKSRGHLRPPVLHPQGTPLKFQVAQTKL